MKSVYILRKVKHTCLLKAYVILRCLQILCIGNHEILHSELLKFKPLHFLHLHITMMSFQKDRSMASIPLLDTTVNLVPDIFIYFFYLPANKSFTSILTYHSGLVTSTSTTVPGGGFLSAPPLCAKNLVFTRFFTTITVSLGLK